MASPVLQGRYFELYTRQAGLEANRFIKPGEREQLLEPEVTKSGRPDQPAFAAAGVLGKLLP